MTLEVAPPDAFVLLGNGPRFAQPISGPATIVISDTQPSNAVIGYLLGNGQTLTFPVTGQLWARSLSGRNVDIAHDPANDLGGGGGATSPGGSDGQLQFNDGGSFGGLTAAEARALLALGTAAQSNVGDFDAAGAASSAIATHEAASDPHPGYLTAAEGNAAYQPKDGELDALAGLSSASNKVPYFTGSEAAALADFTAAGRAIVGAADAAAQRTEIGVPRPIFNSGARLYVRSRDDLALITAADLAGADKTKIEFICSRYHADGPDVEMHFWWQAGAAPAWDTSALEAHASLGGNLVQFFSREISVLAGGAKGDYDRATKTITTDDRDALNWLAKASSAYKLPGIIQKPCTLVISDASDVIELLDDTKIIGVGGGAICFNAEAGVPMIWQDGKRNIVLDVEICFGGTLDQTRYPHRLQVSRFQDFYQNYYPRPGVAESGGPAAASGVAQLGGNGGLSTPVILSAGGRDIVIKPRFTSLTDTGDISDAQHFIRNGCVITNGMNGDEPTNVLYEPTYDGIIMGSNGHDAHSLSIRGTILRAGSLGLLANEGDGSTPNASPHALGYLTTDADGGGVQQGCQDVEIGPVMDKARHYWYTLDGAHATIKGRGCGHLHVHDVVSYNPAGVFQGAANHIDIHDIYAPAIQYAVCTANSVYGLSTSPFHLQDVPSGTPKTIIRGSIHNVFLGILDDVNSTPSVVQMSPEIANLVVRDFNIELAAWSGAGPILELGDVGLNASGIDWEGTVKIASAPAANKTLIRLDGTNSRDNRFKIRLLGFPTTTRFVENVKDSSYRNYAEYIFDDVNGTIKRFASGNLVEVEEDRVFNVTLTGASVVVANAIADGETVLGGAMTIHSAITGATGISWGISGGTGSEFGSVSGTAAGSTKTNSASYTDGGAACKYYSAATSLVFLPLGPNFTGGVANAVLRIRRYETTFNNDLGGLA